MTRIIVGFDPSRGQPAIAELRSGLGPGIEWRVLNLDQNPNGVEPTRSQAGEEQQDESPHLLQRLAGWFGGDKDSAQEQGAEHPTGGQAADSNMLELSEEELAYLRRAPARAGTVLLITVPESEASAVRLWSMRHGGFNLAPALESDTESETKES